jgi:hypothetical protein
MRSLLHYLKATALWVVLLGTLVIIGRQAWGKPRPAWWAPKKVTVPTEREMGEVIHRVVSDPEHNRYWSTKRNGHFVYREKYYQRQQLDNYGKWIVSAVKRNRLPEVFRTVFIATLMQQSKFHYDVESRNNVKKIPIEGSTCTETQECQDFEQCVMPNKCQCRRHRIKRGKKRVRMCVQLVPMKSDTKHGQAPKKAEDGQDYGLFQHHWPVKWTKCGGAPCTLKHLLNPEWSIRLAGGWFRQKKSMCEDWMGSKPPKCDLKTWDRQSGVTCKCRRTKLATGALWVNGNPASIGRIQRRVERIIAEVRKEDRGEEVVYLDGTENLRPVRSLTGDEGVRGVGLLP